MQNDEVGTAVVVGGRTDAVPSQKIGNRLGARQCGDSWREKRYTNTAPSAIQCEIASDYNDLLSSRLQVHILFLEILNTAKAPTHQLANSLNSVSENKLQRSRLVRSSHKMHKMNAECGGRARVFFLIFHLQNY
jgi:hypothetical protein